jgi:hypothetical protein
MTEDAAVFAALCLVIVVIFTLVAWVGVTALSQPLGQLAIGAGLFVAGYVVGRGHRWWDGR